MRAIPFAQRNPLNAITWQFRREFFVVGLFSLVANVLLLAPTLYMLQLYDRVMKSHSELTLLVVSLLTLFLFGVMAFAHWVRSRLLVRTGVRFDALINNQVFKASFEAALNQSGRKPREAFTDLANLRQFATGNGVFAFFDAPWTPIYLVVVFLLHPWLGLISILFALILVLVAWLSHRASDEDSLRVLEASSRLSGFVQSRLRNVESIEAMGMFEHLRRRWANLSCQHLSLLGRTADANQRIQSVTKFIQLSQQSLMLAAGAWLVIRGEISPASMIAANVLMGRALQPLQQVVASWKGFFAARQSYCRLISLLSDYPDRTGLTMTAPLQGDVVLCRIEATAPGRKVPILQDVDAKFAPGELIAIIGPSGSGKSTLARCLMGIWPYQKGEVLLDGSPITAWDRHELGPHLGYMPQDVELLEGTIAENIARFGPVDSSKVIAAARATGIHDMILHFPQGYDTPMGVAGRLLSAGQRQRIALARAMYGEPALLVLDEPNANLDDAGEKALLQSLQQLKNQRKTVFVISHRGSVLSLADRLLVLAQGRIQHLGPTAEILGRVVRSGNSANAVSATA